MCVFDDVMCLLLASLCVNTVHRGKFCFDDPLCSLYDPLKSLPLCQGGITVPDGNAGCEDALHQAFVRLSEGTGAQASLPEQPVPCFGKVTVEYKLEDRHTVKA